MGFTKELVHPTNLFSLMKGKDFFSLHTTPLQLIKLGNVY